MCVYLLRTYQNGTTNTIAFPQGAELDRVSAVYEAKSSIPGVVGAIDCSYIYVQKPRKRRYKAIADRFYGRKGCAILLQAVAGPERQFYDVDIRMPASAGDWTAYKRSSLFRKLRSPQPPFPRGKVLLADAGYYADYFLLLPFARMDDYTNQEHNYNYLHSRSRVDVEDAFGILKMRWRRLHSSPIEEDIDFVPTIVKVACILHNLCRLRQDRAGIDARVIVQDLGGVQQAVERPEQDMNEAEAAVPQLPVGFVPEAILLDVDDRVALRQEHDAHRAIIKNNMPDVYVNRARLNRPGYFGPQVVV